MLALSEDVRDYEENLRALRASAESVRSGDTLTLAGGRYLLGDAQSIGAQRLLLEGGVSARQTYDAYESALVLRGVRDVTLDFQGARLVFKGFIQPIGLTDCEHVTLRNLTIDFERPAFSEGVVVDAAAGSAVVRVFPEYPLRGGEPVVSFQSYDRNTGFLTGVCPFTDVGVLELLGPQTVRLVSGEAKFLMAGDFITIRHSYGYRPGISLTGCRDVRIEDVSLSGLTGMGVVGYRCRDLSFSRYRVTPGKGRLMSISADGIHLVSTGGRVDVTDCDFEGMGDDAVNVHGYYYRIAAREGARVLRMFIQHSYDPGYRYEDYPEEGDRFELVDGGTLLPFAENRVMSAAYDPETRESRLTFEEPLPPALPENCLLANVDKAPALRVSGCRMFNIRGRAVLVQTRDVRLENNRFYHLTGQAVHIDTAAPWMESCGARNVRILNNRFKDCGHGATGYATSSGITIETECSRPCIGVHRDIVMEGNLFIGGAKPVLDIRCAQRVLVKHNRMLTAQALARVSDSADVLFTGNQCENERLILGANCREVRVE